MDQEQTLGVHHEIEEHVHSNAVQAWQVRQYPHPRPKLYIQYSIIFVANIVKPESKAK